MKIINACYINMDHRQDKDNHMINQLASCPNNIKLSRFSGLNITDYLQYDVHNYINPGSQMHKGIIGCWMSHKSVIKKYIDSYNNFSNEEWTLILEDDIIIDPSFWAYLEPLKPPEDADMIFFDSGRNDLLKDEYLIDSNFKLYKIYSSFPDFVGTHCYAIRNSCLNKLYNILDGVVKYKDIDGYYFFHKNLVTYNYQSGLIKINYKFQSDRLTPL